MQTWEDIQESVQAALGGRSETARASLQGCWDRTSPEDAAQRCVIAHYLADQQDNFADEIAWDERALEAFDGITDDDLAPIGIPSATGFAPSLHLNLGDGYLRAGDLPKARAQVEQAQAAMHLLPAEGYGAMIRGGIQRLAEKITDLSQG